MIEAAVIVLPLLQYAAGSILLGSALFFTHALPRMGPRSATGFGWPRPLLLAAAPMLAVSAVLGLLAQTALLAGSVEAALTADALRAAFGGIDFGKAAVLRIGAAEALRGLSVLAAVAWFGTLPPPAAG